MVRYVVVEVAKLDPQGQSRLVPVRVQFGSGRLHPKYNPSQRSRGIRRGR